MSPLVLFDLIAFAVLIVAWVVLPTNGQQMKESALEALATA
jgi:hypothetical protein